MSEAYCFSCNKVLGFDSGNVGRRDTCPSCGTDAKVCYNCRHHDQSAYNECKEPQAERVLEKDRSNFCDFFSLNMGAHSAKTDSKADALAQLDDLFKK